MILHVTCTWPETPEQITWSHVIQVSWPHVTCQLSRFTFESLHVLYGPSWELRPRLNEPTPQPDGDKPRNAIPISNKWVLTKKWDKEGNLVKYKAHLVACSFTQRPGLDYNETFSPVIHFKTIRALLAMVPSKKLKVRQLDVKGAYLNGILTQPIYMEQPTGFDDKSRLVCLLIKGIYSLKPKASRMNMEHWIWPHNLATQFSTADLGSMHIHPTRRWPICYSHCLGWRLAVICNNQWTYWMNKNKFGSWVGTHRLGETCEDCRNRDCTRQPIRNNFIAAIPQIHSEEREIG